MDGIDASRLDLARVTAQASPLASARRSSELSRLLDEEYSRHEVRERLYAAAVVAGEAAFGKADHPELREPRTPLDAARALRRLGVFVPDMGEDAAVEAASLSASAVVEAQLDRVLFEITLPDGAVERTAREFINRVAERSPAPGTRRKAKKTKRHRRRVRV